MSKNGALFAFIRVERNLANRSIFSSGANCKLLFSSTMQKIQSSSSDLHFNNLHFGHLFGQEAIMI